MQSSTTMANHMSGKSPDPPHKLIKPSWQIASLIRYITLYAVGLISPGVSVPVQIPGGSANQSDVSHAMQVAAAAQYGGRWVS